MDYTKLAEELFEYLKFNPKRMIENQITEATRGEIEILVYLQYSTGEVTSGELSIRLKKTTARIANTLNTLEKKGLIMRLPDMADRRKTIVKITQEGINYESTKRTEALKNLAKLLEALGEHDAREHLRIMKKIHVIMTTENMDKEMIKNNGENL